ncbi:MAG: hypothetical protein KZQ76_14635, partial [Candidatus Thiodiazotropha sp. (ex Epidulcina cf. delphinae)]|nr:hypothetical protein [Candidatus Thiodiazotropha sp. (ex Epidulcina cf. delphinae)]
GVLSRAQQAVYLASFAATPAIVREVVEKNDQRYSAKSAYAVIGLGENAMGWSDFAKQYDDQTGLLRKADVVNRSKDEFTNARNLGTSQLLPGSPDVLDLGIMRLWVRKEGRTNLITEDTASSDDGETGTSSAGTDMAWEWKGKDTLSLHKEELKMTRRGPRWRHQEIPLGWGSRYVNGDFECEENEDGWEVCPRYMSQNRQAERLADRESEALDADYEGLRAYYDLMDLSRENKDPRLVLRTEVELPQSELKTASKIDGLGSDSVPSEALRSGIGEGMFGTEDQMAGDGMTSIAGGELFFHPPDDYNPARRRGRYEIASLFSPYWEVKLTKTPIERRLMAWALRDEALFTRDASGVAGGADHFLGEQTEELERLRRRQQALQSRLGGAVDEATRAQIETQLNTVTAQISALESIDYGTGSMIAGLRREMAQGLSSAANAQVADYQRMLEASAAQQGEELVNRFEDEVVGQVTDQLQQALEQAVEGAVDNAISSLL